jgi:hypothetical protein
MFPEFATQVTNCVFSDFHPFSTRNLNNEGVFLEFLVAREKSQRAQKEKLLFSYLLHNNMAHA